MPLIRSIQINTDGIEISDRKFNGINTVRLLNSDIPSNQNTLPRIENYINNFLNSKITDYQIQVHVFSISPLLLTIGTFDLGIQIPSNWWEEQ